MASLETVREEQNKTQLEIRGNETVIEAPISRKITDALSEFRDYSVLKQLPSNSTEADIFVVEKNNTQYILKLYRYGIEPKADILKKIIALGEKFPDKFLMVLEADYDSGTKRWFEIQEYVKFGSLSTVVDNCSKFNDAQRNSLFKIVANEVGSELSILHKNNLLHLDIKPSNILIRSKNPFHLVLIDFGISTSLASDVSKKFTQTRGTPMYQSPESWAGSMNRVSDWWGLGMILLEIASGRQPFSGLDYKVIASIMATRSVEIPENIDSGQKEILRGLLTRDPDKRWKWNQVYRWLKGERNIGDSFQEDLSPDIASSREKANATPIKFLGEQCYSLEEFSALAVKNPDAWEKGRGFLMRGYIRQWLEENKDFDTNIEIEQMLNPVESSDEKLFCLTQKFGKDLPFIFCGHLTTMKNLLLFLGKALRRENLSPSEQKIVDAYHNGVLKSCTEFAAKLRSSLQPDFKAVQIFLNDYKDKDFALQVGLLDFCVNPKKYYCPFLNASDDIVNITQTAATLTQVPIETETITGIDREFFIPKEIISAMKSSASGYDYSLQTLKALGNTGKLFPKSGYSDKEKRMIRKILPLINPAHQTRGFIDFYLYPKKYYCPFLKGVSTLEEFISRSWSLTTPPRLLNEWQELENRYILPAYLVKKTLEAETYSKALKNLGTSERSGNLILREGNERFIKEAVNCKNAEDYAKLLTRIKRIKIGYDDKNVKVISNSLKYFKKEISKSDISALEHVRLDFLIAYLEFLARTVSQPLTDKEKNFLRDIKNHKKARELADYVCASIDEASLKSKAHMYLEEYEENSRRRNKQIRAGTICAFALVLMGIFSLVDVNYDNFIFTLIYWGIVDIFWLIFGHNCAYLIDDNLTGSNARQSFWIIYILITVVLIIITGSWWRVLGANFWLLIFLGGIAKAIDDTIRRQ